MVWIRTAAFFLLLLAAAAGDLRNREVPRGDIPGIFLAGLLCFNPIKLFGVFAGAPIFILALICKDRLGFGDVWLTIAAGSVVGFEHGLWAQIIAYSSMLFFYVGCRIYRKYRPHGRVLNQPYPLAPFISFGFIAAYFL